MTQKLTNISLERIKDKILTAVEYKSKAESEEELEFKYELKEGDKSLYYFGAYHRHGIDHPMLQEIKEKMNEFKPDIVYVEGVRMLRNQLTKEQIESIKKEPIENFGTSEAWYTAKLAMDKDIPVECPEPDFKEEVEYIRHKGFDSKDIFSYYLFRVVNQYLNYDKNAGSDLEHFKKYIHPFIERSRKDGGWNEEEFTKLEADFWQSLRLNDKEFYEQQCDPIPWKGKKETKINEIARQSSLFRDRHIVGRITEGLKKYNRLFVVYGSAHAVKQEPALRELIKII